jgi:hypothetical protein
MSEEVQIENQATENISGPIAFKKLIEYVDHIAMTDQKKVNNFLNNSLKEAFLKSADTYEPLQRAHLQPILNQLDKTFTQLEQNFQIVVTQLEERSAYLANFLEVIVKSLTPEQQSQIELEWTKKDQEIRGFCPKENKTPSVVGLADSDSRLTQDNLSKKDNVSPIEPTKSSVEETS